MPNWCYNTLTIQGPKSEVDMIKDRLNKPFTLAQETFGMGDISTMGFPKSLSKAAFTKFLSFLLAAFTSLSPSVSWGFLLPATIEGINSLLREDI